METVNSTRYADSNDCVALLPAKARVVLRSRVGSAGIVLCVHLDQAIPPVSDRSVNSSWLAILNFLGDVAG
jgi:hypothetical protein